MTNKAKAAICWSRLTAQSVLIPMLVVIRAQLKQAIKAFFVWLLSMTIHLGVLAW